MTAEPAVEWKRGQDLQRILALPQRPPLDCERERGHRRWAPEAQALVEVVTSMYTKGPRLSCACRPRHVEVLSGGRLLIFATPPPKRPPPPPVETTVEAFCADAAHDVDAVEAVTRLYAGQSVQLPGLGYPFCLTEFNPSQAWGLWELPIAGGLFGMISVGGGKTILGIMAPLAMPKLRHPDGSVAQWILLAKPNQRLHYRNAYLRLREHFRVPSIVFEDKSLKGSFRERGQPVLHFIPYSLLSNPRSSRLFEMLDPDGAIADEFHLLANRESARTLRFLRAMATRERVMCGWSGSTIKRSMRDCSHLAAHSLGLGSPYPILPPDVNDWSRIIDPSATPDRVSALAKALLAAFGSKKVDEQLFASGFAQDGGIREGHRDRVISTPGVISTRSSSVTCSISIKERKVEGGVPDVVRDALKSVRAGLRPDGDPLGDAMEIAVCGRRVSCGYYHYWSFPRATDEERAEGGLIDQWYAARKAFSKELRSKTLLGEPDLDSRSLCENAAKRAWQKPPYDGDLPLWQAMTWPEWAAIENAVYYEPKTKLFDDFLAKDAAEWAREKPGIVWVRSTTLGKKIAELAGIEYYGENSEEALAAESGSRSIVASMRAHGESTDGLQHKFARQLIIEPPSSGDGWEQLLGRLAREGQVADEVETEVYLHTSELRDAMRSAVLLAQFIEETTPNRQLLLAADIDFDL